MTDELPDWLSGSDEGVPPPEARHLRVLRRLLAQDYLIRADWHFALTDLARMAQVGLEADKTMVASFEPATGSWEAVNSEGEWLGAEAISTYGSVATLEKVRRRGAPLLTTTDEPLDFQSHSMALHNVGSVLAVPLYWWDVTGETRERRLEGCLYAHRTARRPGFDDADIELFLDIARLAQPTLNVLRHMAELEAENARKQLEIEELRSEQSERLGQLESRDPMFARHVLGRLRRVAQADRVGLLILGPTGSGKSHLARAYHNECPRQAGPFVTFDCSQVTSATTLAAELFGYASRSGYANAPPEGRPGKAELADGGTLFIDEVGVLPGELQQRLLRLLQEGRFAPLGGSREVEVDVQIIAATNEPLAERARAGTFREDLLWRLGELTIRMPPLDQRAADVPDLARHFFERARERFGKTHVTGFSQAAIDRLVRHRWSVRGNIRGLEQVVTRSLLLVDPEAREIGVGDLQLDDPFEYDEPALSLGAHARSRDTPPTPSTRASALGPAPASLRPFLLDRLAAHDYNVRAVASDAAVASRLGYAEPPVPTTSLYNQLRELGLLDRLDDLRRAHKDDRLQSIIEAIRASGSGAAAARSLDMTRDALVWQLRKAGTSITAVLAGDE